MRGLPLLAGLVVFGLIISGCEKKDETTVTPANTTDTQKSMGDAAKDAQQKASDTMAGAADKAKEMGTAAGESAKEMGSAAVTEANRMIDQVKTYINEKKFTDAETVLAKLDGMRAQLPESIQKMIDECKTMLEKAKAAMK